MKVSSNSQTRRKSKKLGTPLDYSLKLLSLRSYTEKVMAEKLIQKGFSTGETALAIKKLKEYGYLDDGKFGRNLIDDGKRKLVGRIKLSYSMHKKGIGRHLIDELLENYYPVEEERSIATLALEKKSHSLIKYKENTLLFKKKLYDFLHSRGFSSGIIEDILNI